MLIALGIAAVATLILAMGLGLWEGLGGAEISLTLVILAGVVAPWLGLAGWPLIATAWRGNGPRIDLGLRFRRSDLFWGAGAGVVALGLAALAAMVTSLVDDSVTSSAAELAAQLQDSGGPVAIIVFSLAVMVGAPFVEELFFRGLFFAALRKRGLSAAWTIVVTAIAFVVFHLEPMRMLILLPTAVVLGWVRWRTGSLGSAMVAHGVVNAPGAISLLLGSPGVTP